MLNYLNQKDMKGEHIVVPDVAASFQQAVVDVLVGHSMEAVENLRREGMTIRKFAIAGGVASNSALRSQMEEACAEHGLAFCCPPPILCTDNAAMIGCAAYYEYRRGRRSGYDLNAMPNLKLGESVYER